MRFSITGRKKSERSESVETISPPPSYGESNSRDSKTSSRERSGLFTLKEPSYGNEHAIDIVAVHGLGGDWESSWTHKSNNSLWLRDFLPTQLPNARIMSYGYDSDIFSSSVADIDDVAISLLDSLEGEERIDDQAGRPVIFISHSLGGIIVKKALILAHQRLVIYGDFLHRVGGLVFFGVPHRGADLAFWGSFAANLASTLQLGLSANTRFVTSLRKNSRNFAEISQQFLERGAQLPIRTFYETERYMGQLVVDKDSAILHLPNEVPVPVLGADHRSMVKFSHANSQRYLQVSRAIGNLARAVTGDLQTALKPPSLLEVSKKGCFLVPFEQDTQFIGREQILTDIDDQFKRQKRIALAGIGGIGKSQIAIEYCYRFQQLHPESHIFWVPAASAYRIDQAYREIADALRLPGGQDPKIDVFHLVSKSLSSDKYGSWLLVLDNADDLETFFDVNFNPSPVSNDKKEPLVHYVPGCLNGQILVTSRDISVGEALCHHQTAIMVLPMEVSEAESLLSSKVSMSGRSDNKRTRQLLDILGHLPLAITQAAAYIKKTGITVDEYLDIICTSDSELEYLLSNDMPDLRRDSKTQHSIIKTWKISFDMIRNKWKRAAEILSLMAVLDNQGIPRTLLQKENERQAEFRDALGTLRAFSLVSSEKSGSILGIHRLVQISTRIWLEIFRETSRWRTEGLKSLATAYPTGAYENWDTCQSLSTHANEIVKHNFSSDLDLFRVKLLTNMATYDEARGRYHRAQEKIIQVLAIQKRTLDPEHPDTLASMNHLAQILWDLAKYEQAEKMQREVLELQSKTLGPEHPKLLLTTTNLANSLHRLGRYKDAEDMHRKVLEIRQKLLGPEHPETLVSMHNMAKSIYRQGKYQTAEVLHRTVLERRQKVLPPDHPAILKSMYNLAKSLHSQGKYKQAAEMHEQILKNREKVLGPEHLDTIRSMYHLANAWQDQKLYQEAERVHRRALAMSEKALGPDHVDTIRSMYYLGNCFLVQEKYIQAEEIHQRALDLSKTSMGLEHPDTLMSMYCVAESLACQGKYEASEKIHREAFTLRNTLLGPLHPDTILSKQALTNSLRKQGKDETVLTTEVGAETLSKEESLSKTFALQKLEG